MPTVRRNSRPGTSGDISLRRPSPTRISQENFLKDSEVLSDAKIRASYGLTGNNRVGDFAYMSQLNLSNVDGYSWNNQLVQGAQLQTLGNYNLKWESTKAADIGLDLGFFNQRIGLTMDYYHKKTYDLLLNANLPLSSGYQRAMMNVGAVRNSGFELTLNTVNVQTKNFMWSTNFNISIQPLQGARTGRWRAEHGFVHQLELGLPERSAL